jgi:hypothetical protein
MVAVNETPLAWGLLSDKAHTTKAIFDNPQKQSITKR